MIKILAVMAAGTAFCLVPSKPRDFVLNVTMISLAVFASLRSVFRARGYWAMKARKEDK
jgi:hypothetical protein